MPKPTGYELKNYCKALETCAIEVGYASVQHGYNKGSVYSFKIFEKGNSTVPAIVWSVHYGRGKKEEIWSGDLAKAWKNTVITRERFLQVLDSL